MDERKRQEEAQIEENKDPHVQQQLAEKLKNRRSPVDEFIQKARDKFKYVVRDFEFNPSEYEQKKINRTKFVQQTNEFQVRR